MTPIVFVCLIFSLFCYLFSDRYKLYYYLIRLFITLCPRSEGFITRVLSVKRGRVTSGTHRGPGREPGVQETRPRLVSENQKTQCRGFSESSFVSGPYLPFVFPLCTLLTPL